MAKYNIASELTRRERKRILSLMGEGLTVEHIARSIKLPAKRLWEKIHSDAELSSLAIQESDRLYQGGD